MKGVEGAGVYGRAEYLGGFLADVLGQIDGFGSYNEIFPAGLPELQSRLWTDGDFVDCDNELVEVADGVAVVFDVDF